MDAYNKEMKNGFEDMQGSSSSTGNAIPKCELPDEVMSILSSPCTNDECLDIRLEIHHQQNKLEEKLEEVKQLESCILKLTTKMAQINCECNQQHNGENAFEAVHGVNDSSPLQETFGPTISVDGLDYPTSLLVNATCTIQKALVSTVSSVVNPVPAIPIVLGENNEKASSPSNTDADEIDSGIQIDYEEKEPGIINFINPPLVENPPADESGKEQEQEDPKAEIPETPQNDKAPAIDEAPQIDEDIRKQLIENARQQNLQRMEAKRDSWSEKERALFKNGLKIHGKNFGEIAKSIGTKNLLECVEYYYDTKLIVKYKIGGIPKGKSGVTLAIRKPEEKKRKRTESVESNDGEQKKKEQAAGKNGQEKKKQKKDKEEEEKYEVDYIFGKREKRNGKPGYEYRVFWKGYTRADSTWEPEENLKGCAKAIKRFNKQQIEVLDDKTNEKK